jgi:hypothetical protein
LTHPRILSYDHYPITVGTDKDVAEGRGLPNVFADHKIVVKPDFFECLDLLRHLSNFYGIPLWAFTCSVRHGPYPTPTEGHMRFQLFNDLTYGAKGLQYFTYAHDEAMVRRDGSTTETWEIARRINGEVHNLAPVLRKLRNVEVFHNGTLWSGTRRLQRTGERLGIDVKGDQVTVGLFLGDKDLRYVMVVNANPCGWARMSIEVSVDTEKLYYVDPRDRVVRELWPPNPKSQLVCLAPGEARLFQIGGEGAGKNF